MRSIICALLLGLSASVSGQNTFPATGTTLLHSGTDQNLFLKDGRIGTHWNYIEWQFSDGSRDWVLGRRAGTGYFTLWRHNKGEVLTVDNNGKVGIGTISPEGQLEIKGPYSGNSQLIINTTSSSAELRFSENDTPKGFVWYAPGSNTMAFGRGSEVNSLFVSASGQFGFGTTTPDAKLSVKGQVHAQEVKVDLNGAIAPDYVFDKDYKLPSLEEIQSYITTNKHLPEIPSAREMEANGLNLGEMNLLLLKKVEELTLYILEQDARIQKLENKRKR